ncbi:hypothetical protein C1645_732819 [Glomus cerebriforme]|uniref:Uncharacterized protein n=1 Tax=Glomus cerebriforme TaxID=658196 RepID=A0A397TPQ1_9GLOM|nr:hypothetical protein C1645_732819 [Glomus cerebriforme]
MQIYRKEVLKIDLVNTKGRAKEVVITKTKDVKNFIHMFRRHESTAAAITTAADANANAADAATTAITITDIARSRHITTVTEKVISMPYFENSNPSNDETEVVLNSLLKLLPNYWKKRKLKMHGDIHKEKKINMI